MTNQEIGQLLNLAQTGNEEAKNLLIKAMIEDRCMSRLSRYLYMNKLLEPDEVRGEFWLGVSESIQKARPDIGNPLKFLTQCGIWRVVNTLKSRFREGVSLACGDCGKRCSLTSRAAMAACPSCGSANVETKSMYVSMDSPPEPLSHIIEIDDIIDVFKSQLRGRELQTFEMIIEDYNRDSSNNYLKAIATQMGVSAPCVAVYLRKIRYKLRRFANEVKR